jgi:collagen type III alpha
MAPSPSSLLGGPPSLGPDSLSSNIFSTDFIQSVASSLDEFDPAMFRPDGDINFERDFGQWFNQDAMGGGPLDNAMK